MENLAKAIVESAHLVGQALVHLSSNQVGADPASQTSAATTITSIVGNLATFLAQLTIEIAKLVH